ncbi:MAG: hypothetical protein H7Z39_05840 [Burkholderiaceae bacterium]|nr:hypothetical protein [Burkholderiaceae bacterium]
MNSKKYNILLAGLMCLGLGACSTSPDRNNVNTINAGELYGETAGGIGMVTAPAMVGAGAAGSSGMGSSTRSGASGASSSYGSGTSSGGAAMSSGTSSGGASGVDVQSPGMTSYGVIHSIDAIPRTQAFGSAAATGGSGGGQSGSSGAMTGGSSDMVYRVTLRMDDGSTRAVIQESRPSFQSGDRVRMASNLLQHY